MSLSLPNTWKPCKDEQMVKIYDEVYEEAKSLGLLTKHHKKQPLYVKKSVRSWGQCRWRKMLDNTYDCAICLNEKIILAKSYDAARHVLVHEIAHIATPAEHHSSIWRRAGNMIGKKWNITVDRTGQYEGIELKDKAEAKYIVECPKCHNQWKYNRMCKTVEKPHLYRCAKCQEDLVRIK